jgi:hypothetical protein
MAGHLINTFILLAFLSLTAWFATGGKSLTESAAESVFFYAGDCWNFACRIERLDSGFKQYAFSFRNFNRRTSEGFFLNLAYSASLRVSHPILSIAVGVYLVFLAGWLKPEQGKYQRYSLGERAGDFSFDSVCFGRGDAADSRADCNAIVPSVVGGRRLDFVRLVVGKRSGGRKGSEPKRMSLLRGI